MSAARRPALHGVRAVAAETGVDSRFVALLAREGYTKIIWSLVMVEQQRRRRPINARFTPGGFRIARAA